MKFSEFGRPIPPDLRTVSSPSDRVRVAYETLLTAIEEIYPVEEGGQYNSITDLIDNVYQSVLETENTEQVPMFFCLGLPGSGKSKVVRETTNFMRALDVKVIKILAEDIDRLLVEKYKLEGKYLDPQREMSVTELEDWAELTEEIITKASAKKEKGEKTVVMVELVGLKSRTVENQIKDRGNSVIQSLLRNPILKNNPKFIAFLFADLLEETIQFRKKIRTSDALSTLEARNMRVAIGRNIHTIQEVRQMLMEAEQTEDGPLKEDAVAIEELVRELITSGADEVTIKSIYTQTILEILAGLKKEPTRQRIRSLTGSSAWLYFINKFLNDNLKLLGNPKNSAVFFNQRTTSEVLSVNPSPNTQNP